MTSAADPAAAGDRRNASDVAGVIVLAACAIWSLVTAGAHDGRPEGVLLAILAVAAGYASGRILGALLPVAAPCAGALAGLGLAVTAPHTTPGPQITSPLGHSGATAALLILSAGAACCAAWAARPLVLRFALRLLAAGIVVTAAVLGSTTGVVLCTGVLLCSLAAARMRRRALGLAGLALTTALVTGTTWAIAENVLPDGLTAALEGPLTQHRVLLWRDALHLARESPALGAGPGRYGEIGPTVTQSLLPDGKPHSAPLQQAAEQGVIGVALLAAVFCWVLYALWRTRRPTPIALTAGAALTALAVVASVGNALSFTTVTAGAGLLAGFATSRPLSEEVPELIADTGGVPPATAFSRDAGD
ncbi:O-antigen ligase family protein [Streptomyces sp. NBC_01356]|uniref:O-antigen ligase family protein n=1 Tax=Streptomyces sp. NBC_01356 TaxID=2903836 RepID=UPI002E30A525|nr:O-antigen ligase family protein [Streptomyces sp. NBC_01356]